MYSLIGRPQANDPRYSSLERMTRIYIGIHDRQRDINDQTTYYATDIISVFYLNTLL